MSGRIVGTLFLLALFCGLSTTALAQQGAGGGMRTRPQDPLRAQSGKTTNQACTREPEAPKKEKIIVEVKKNWFFGSGLRMMPFHYRWKKLKEVISEHKCRNVVWKIEGMSYKTAQLIKEISYISLADATSLMEYYDIISDRDKWLSEPSRTFGIVLLDFENEIPKQYRLLRDPIFDKHFCNTRARIQIYKSFREALIEAMGEGLDPEGKGISRLEDYRIEAVRNAEKYLHKLVPDYAPFAANRLAKELREITSKDGRIRHLDKIIADVKRKYRWFELSPDRKIVNAIRAILEEILNTKWAIETFWNTFLEKTRKQASVTKSLQ